MFVRWWPKQSEPAEDQPGVALTMALKSENLEKVGTGDESATCKAGCYRI